jgi:hypothetical protein
MQNVILPFHQKYRQILIFSSLSQTRQQLTGLSINILLKFNIFNSKNLKNGMTSSKMSFCLFIKSIAKFSHFFITFSDLSPTNRIKHQCFSLKFNIFNSKSLYDIMQNVILPFHQKYRQILSFIHHFLRLVDN